MKTITSWLKQNKLILTMESKTDSVFEPHAFGINNTHTQTFVARFVHQGKERVCLSNVESSTEITGTSNEDSDTALYTLLTSLGKLNTVQVGEEVLDVPTFDDNNVADFIDYIEDMMI